MKKKIIILLLIAVIIVSILLIITQNRNSYIQAVNTAKSTYKILVDVEESKLYLFENEQLIKTYNCSGGKWSTPSPCRYMDNYTKGKMG